MQLCNFLVIPMQLHQVWYQVVNLNQLANQNESRLCVKNNKSSSSSGEKRQLLFVFFSSVPKLSVVFTAILSYSVFVSPRTWLVLMLIWVLVNFTIVTTSSHKNHWNIPMASLSYKYLSQYTDNDELDDVLCWWSSIGQLSLLILYPFCSLAAHRACRYVLAV